MIDPKVVTPEMVEVPREMAIAYLNGLALLQGTVLDVLDRWDEASIARVQKELAPVLAWRANNPPVLDQHVVALAAGSVGRRDVLVTETLQKNWKALFGAVFLKREPEMPDELKELLWSERTTGDCPRQVANQKIRRAYELGKAAQR